MHHHSHNKGSNEALIALFAFVGLGVLISQDKITSWSDVWFFSGILGIVAAFYFILLLCSAIHMFMTADNDFWWEKYEHHQNRIPKVDVVKKSK